MRARSEVPQIAQSNEDRDLVLAFQAGDERVYEDIYRRHSDRVRAICKRILGNGPDAEEAAQEAFLRAYVAMGRFNGRYQLGAWLARIAANVCFDQLRLRSRTVQTTELQDAHNNTVTALKGPEREVEDQITIGATLKEMPSLHSKALFLRAVEGMSHNEIADQLEMSTSQVKALLHRARASFKKVWSSASGWGLAFLWGLRERLDGRLKQLPGTADVAASAGPQLSLVAERVATSAVVVALAITGSTPAPVTPRSPEKNGANEVARTEGVQRRGHGTTTLPRVVASTAADAAAASVREQKRRDGAADLVASLDLPFQLPQQPRGRKQADQPGGGSADREEETSPVPAPARPLVGEAEEILEDIPPF